MPGRFLFGAVPAAFLALSAITAAGQEPADQPDFPTTVFVEGERSAAISAGDLAAGITVERLPEVDPDLDFPVLRVAVKGAEVLRAVGAGSSLDFPAAEASIAEIDPTNDFEEIYFTSYSGGAHCCSRVIVATHTAGGWTATEVGEFDGDGGFLEDIDGDGTAEIVTTDDRFLYRFDCYSCSAAPLRVITVRNGTVLELSGDPRFRDAHRRWLEQIEEDIEPGRRWSSPGFLAGWMATRIRLGDGEAAWQELIDHWDFDSDPGSVTCLTGAEADKCPRRSRTVLKFPERLKLFLEQNGYGF